MSRIGLVTLLVFNVVPMFAVMGGSASAGTISYGGNVGSNLGSTCASPGSQTVIANRDTYVQENDSSDHGGLPHLRVQRQSGALARTLVRFPLPSLPSGCVITSASLRLRHGSGDTGVVHSVQRLGSDWAESVNWAGQPSASGTPVNVNVGSNWNQWSVDQLVRDMYEFGNYGFLVRHSNEVGAASSTDYNSLGNPHDPELFLSWNNAPATTMSTNVTSAVPQGNSVVVSFGIDAQAIGVVSASDSEGNIYSVDADASNSFGGRSVILSAHDVNALSPGDTITVTHPASSTRGMSVNQFSGLAPTGTLDGASAASGTSSTPSAGSVSTGQPDELIVGSFVVADNAPSFTPGGGFTGAPSVIAPGYGGIFTEYRIVSSSGSYSATGTLGQVSPWAGTMAAYRMDIEEPVVEITSPTADEIVLDDVPTISGTASFANSDSEYVTVTVHEGADTSGPIADTLSASRASDGSWSIDTTSLPDGQYTVVAEQEDGATNVGTSAPITFFIDTTVPDPPAITGPAPNPGNDPSPEWAFTGEANATFECRLEKGVTYDSGWASCTSPQEFSLLDGEGTYTFSVRQTDLASYQSQPASIDYEFDATAPDAATFTGPVSPGNATDITLDFSSEAGTTAECSVTLGATLVEDYRPCVTGESYSLVDGDGTYTFYVRLTDAAGNESLLAAHDYELDTSIPDTTIDVSIS